MNYISKVDLGRKKIKKNKNHIIILLVIGYGATSIAKGEQQEMEQLSMFDTLWERYKIKKPIRLIELFAGYGSQHLALKYNGANFMSHRIAEWAIKSIPKIER